LDAKVWIGVLVIPVPPLVALVDLDEYLLVHPGLDGYAGVRLVVALELEILLLVLVKGGLLIVLHQKTGDLLGAVLHPLNVKVYLCPYLMLRGPVLLGGVGIEIVSRTAVATGDDHPLTSPLLDEIEEVEEDRVDVFFALEDGEAMAGPITVSAKGRARGIRL
jgi:hypothetical protein